MESEHAYIAKWRARLVRVRQAVRDLIGLETEGVIPDGVAAGLTARAEAVADLAAGASEEPRTRAEVVAVATAAAVAIAADIMVHVYAALDAARAEEMNRAIAAAAERIASELERRRGAVAAVAAPPKKDEPGL